MVSSLVIGSVLVACSLGLVHLPITYAVNESDRTSAIEKRQQFLDRFCIGICPKGPIGTEDIKDGATV